ncbi:MAG: RDD family protein [Flavobacteriales bacterium]|nr:RDD family protein [Flavobacteriales bacterium]MCA0392227.1 RDD family protein [Bacteroidota bacterium]
MKNIQIKLIFYTSLAISILGILAELGIYYIFDTPRYFNQESILPRVLGYFRIIYLQIGFDYMKLNIYNIVFYVLLFFGSIFFIKTKGTEVRLIRLFYSVLLISSIFILLRIIIFNLFFNFNNEFNNDSLSKKTFFSLINFAYNLFFIFLSFKFLKITSLNRELKITEKQIGEKIKTEIEETTRLERFLHHILDTLFIIFLLFSISGIFFYFKDFKGTNIIPDFLNNRFGIYVFIFIMRFIYFPFFERLFGSTPAKFLTNSRVVNSKAEIPSREKIFERTLYRHIPFDAFSFLGRKGWHDSISETYVVKEKNDGISSVYIVWTFVFCCVLMILYTIFFVNF